MLLVSGRVSVPKPLSQIQRSTRWLLQGLSPRTSFGGFGFSIRWKFETAIAIIAALFLIVTLIYSQGMDFMHQELHEIQQLGPPQRSEVLGAADDHGLGLSGRSEVLRAINDLEDTHHGFVFSFLIPFMGVLGVLAAAVLGGAMAWLVIAPASRMGQAMGKIASGDFSEPVQVENQDELGELAGRINQTSEELAKLQEATLAAERDRARWERVTQVTTAQEEERRRISRELHDDLGPSLAAIGNRLNACRYMVRTDPERVEGELEDVTKNLRGHIQEIRHLIYDLRPLALDQLGLKGAVRQQVERFGQETGIQASFTMSREVALDPLAEVTIFRVIQECLSNVQKHANASQVKVRLQSMDTGLELTGIPQIKPTFLDIAPSGIPSNIIPHSKGVKCGLIRSNSPFSYSNHRPAKPKIPKPLVYAQVSPLGTSFATP